MLCADKRIEAVTGVGLHPACFDDPKFQAIDLGIDQPALSGVLSQHDALVHLASVALPVRMTANEMFDINVRAAQKLFHAARAAGTRRLIHLSSAAVYGSAIHADEQAQLKPLAGFLYAEHQAQLERLLAIELPECVRVRPHLIVGPHAHPALKRLLRQPFYLRLPSPHPLLQCIHEDDLALGVMLCLHSDARGPYNFAIEDSLRLRDAIQAPHWLRAGLSPEFVRPAIKAAGWLSRWGADPGFFQALSHTLLINCRRAMVELGWRSHYTADTALASI